MIDHDEVKSVESDFTMSIIRLMSDYNITTRMVANVSGLDENGIICYLSGKWSPSLHYFSTVLVTIIQIIKQLKNVSKSDNVKG